MFSFTQPANVVNEDAVGWGKGYCFVIDGASGLNGQIIDNEPSDAAWFIRETTLLLHHFFANHTLDTATILQQTMKKLYKRWPSTTKDMPSASISLFRICGETLELFSLGDCSSSIQFCDGSFFCVEDTVIAALDQGVLREMLRLHREHNLTMAEARNVITPLLKQNRALRNQPQGYWVLDPSGTGISHAYTASFPLSGIRSVFSCSDGFAQLIGFGEAASLSDLHKRCTKTEPNILYQKLYSLQEQDKAMLRLPRFKLRDDASAIYATIEELYL